MPPKILNRNGLPGAGRSLIDICQEYWPACWIAYEMDALPPSEFALKFAVYSMRRTGAVSSNL